MPQALPPKLISMLRFVYTNRFSDFYRKKFDVAGIDIEAIKTSEDFRRLPFATKEELISKNPDEILYTTANKIDRVTYSSGSSGKGLSVLFTHHPFTWKTIVSEHKKIFKQTHRVLILLNDIKAIYAYMTCLRELDKLVVPADIKNLEAAAIIAAKVKIDAIITSPSIASRLAPFINQYYSPDKIKVIKVGGGGGITPFEKRKLKMSYPSALIVSSYHASEAGCIAMQCEYLAQENKITNVYHPLTSQNFIEIVSGEIVLTSLEKSSYVYIRYRTGDRGEFVNINCSCGKALGLKILGRIGDDGIKIAGAVIKKSQIERIVTILLKDYISWGAIHVYEKKRDGRIMPLLVFEVILKSNVNLNIFDQEKIIEIFSNNLFISQNQTLTDLVRSDLFLKPTLHIKERSEAYNHESKTLFDHRWE